MTGASEETYTPGHHESVLRSHRWRTAENSAAYLLPHLSPGQRVLDVGCGPGTITLDLARRVAPGEVLGLDRVEEPLQEARAAAAEQGVTNASFEVGDVYDLGSPDDSFDVLHAHQVLQHLGDPVAALEEMRRVGRSGAVLAVRDADYGAMTWYPADPRLDRWLELVSAATRANGANPDAGRRLLSWVQAAGFDDVIASASVWCFASAEDRAWWGGMWAERIQSSATADQLLSAELSTPAELSDVAEAWRQWAAEPSGWFAVLHGEVLAVVP